jgi:hypothetical protein
MIHYFQPQLQPCSKSEVLHYFKVLKSLRFTKVPNHIFIPTGQ